MLVSISRSFEMATNKDSQVLSHRVSCTLTVHVLRWDVLSSIVPNIPAMVLHREPRGEKSTDIPHIVRVKISTSCTSLKSNYLNDGLSKLFRQLIRGGRAILLGYHNPENLTQKRVKSNAIAIQKKTNCILSDQVMLVGEHAILP